MDFELGPWTDEPETFKPKKPTRLKRPVEVDDSTHYKLPSLVPPRADQQRALRSSSVTSESKPARVVSNVVNSFYRVNPMELRSKLRALADPNLSQKSKLQIPNDQFRPIRRFEQLISDSIHALIVRRVSPLMQNYHRRPIDIRRTNTRGYRLRN
jgi:hypothetical protein